ncbi:AAA family ATPase [Phyllobacterium myrsinacearum]|uniref:Putative ATPase n=1 Tax=Phyllobacterium myrsinacearum TaxID=28101 RepID=A0A839EL55_9HYPH|nr:DUF3696 domain-containing protein [Phyllobacterium myrsinacearum]MBA8877227.1 putative ATPase [Phyllobacterium myrsinacearum]
MLKYWSIGGFKSFKNETSMKLSPITVFAGSNSSGKSTVIQSILMLKQTVQYGSSSRSLALNGPLVRLGTFDDVIHYSADPRAINIELDYEADALDGTFATDRPEWAAHRHWSFTRGKIENVVGKFRWEPRIQTTGNLIEKSDQLQSTVAAAKFLVRRSPTKENEASIDYYIAYSPSSFDTYWDGEETQIRWAEVEMDALSEADLLKDKPDGQITHLALKYFLPDMIRVNFNKGKKRAFEMMEALFGGSFTLLSSVNLEGKFLPVSISHLINGWLTKAGKSLIPIEGETVSAETIRDAINASWRRLGVGINGIRETPEGFDQLKIEVERELLLHFSFEGTDHDYVYLQTIDDGVDMLMAFLRHGVQYLGPLRNEPKPVYPLEALENTAIVGYRGEHTAAVLFLNSEKKIQYLSPADLQSGGSVRNLKYSSLRNAVSEWLEYLGVATGVAATEKGVFGNQLQVTTEGLTKKHDLTNVGVGVSQVLPIVVSCLLAKKGSLMLFEQPELHLHPRVQARLADFFYAVGVSGKQCILETHSEYMIDRFRLRIAEEEENVLQNMLKIYFTERHEGETSCREVKISKYGAVIDWPKDFFEQSQIETRKIIEAASKKRINEKKIDR